MRSFALLVMMGLPAAADSLTGKVLDPSGAAVPRADVSLFDRNSGDMRKTTSSSSGEFSFLDIAAGHYLVEAQSGASSLVASEEVDVNGETTKELKLSVAASTMRILVSATSTPISEQEVTRSIDVVDSKEISRRDEYLVAEALRTVPGVQIQTQVGGVVQVRSRGLGNQYTGVLIDGLRFRDATATQGDASSFYSDFNVTDLGSAEFMRGSGSSLYGTNAIGGTLNLNSNDGGGRTHGAVRVEGGGLGFFRTTLNLAGGLKENKFVYSGGLSYLNVMNGVRGNTPNRNTSGQIFAKYNFTPKLSLSGRFLGSDVFQRSVESPDFPAAVLANFPPGTGIVKAIPLADPALDLYAKKLPFNAGNATFVPSIADPDGKRDSSLTATAFILRHQLTENTSWRASYQFVTARRAYTDGPLGPYPYDPAVPTTSSYKGRTDELQLRYDAEFAKVNRFTGGYELERENMNSISDHPVTVTTGLTRAIGTQFSHSFYGQDQLHFLDNRLQIVLGGRIQKFDLHQPSFTGEKSPYEGVKFQSPETAITGDASIAYFFQKSNTKVRAHVGNGYRAPALYERVGSYYFGGFTYIGDPRLKPEKSKSYEAGIDQYLLHNKIRASATWFYTDLSQIIGYANSFTNDPFGRVFGGYYNVAGGGISRGAELSTQFTPTQKTSVTLSYTYVNADQRSPEFRHHVLQGLQRLAEHLLIDGDPVDHETLKRDCRLLFPVQFV
ncbi:MAG: TonB-dependent receptor [Acidobacteriota bacterium]